MSRKTERVVVLLTREEYKAFRNHCAERGAKMSSVLAAYVRSLTQEKEEPTWGEKRSRHKRFFS